MSLLDWIIVGSFTGLSFIIGSAFAKSASKKGREGFFAAGRNLPWWALGASTAATYQSGQGGFVMLIFLFALAGNWLWWAQWIIWMPLVAIIWSRMWSRMRIVTTAELIGLRYGGKSAYIARKVYAVAMFCFSIITIAYITGFFAKTIAPLVPIPTYIILIVFGSATMVYTLLGGLKGSVMVSVIQMAIMITGSLIFLAIIIPQNGGWSVILDKIELVRGEGLSLDPVSDITPPLTLAMFIILGLFFAGSPTAGEGMTAQRFMAAKSEKHAIGGQLFSALISLSLRILPLVGMGIICITLFWSSDLVTRYGQTPEGFKFLDDPAYAWGELINASKLPTGFVGILVGTEVLAFMSTLSALINWGSSFIVNDIYREYWPARSEKQEVTISRLTTLVLFIIASIVAILFVDDMVSWFIFINSVVVIFWLPLAYFRFFWTRFNAWGELAATILGIPLSILFWFILGFEKKPIWEGTALLFLIALSSIFLITMLTPPESEATLAGFYKRCRPPFGWKKYAKLQDSTVAVESTMGHQVISSFIGIVACFGLAMATNALFVRDWLVVILGISTAAIFSYFLIKRSMMT
jgi:Na+/proline symporter